MRKRLPDRRENITQKLRIIAGDESGKPVKHTLYVTVGFKEDGTPGEVKIVLASTGSGVRAYTDSLSYAISIGMQYGAPLQDFVDQFVGTKFAPNGTVVGYDPIRFCTSPLDLAFRWLGIEYCGMDDLRNVPKTEEEKSGL